MKQFLKIKNRIKQLIKNNKFLAVLSVLIAFGLWLFVSLTVNTEGYAVIHGTAIQTVALAVDSSRGRDGRHQRKVLV